MLVYGLLKRYCTVALKFYFREWEVKGTDNIPPGAVIFAPNHQNAFLDAVLIACSSHRNPFFLARADVFKNRVAGTALRQMRMLPVYRFRDGFRAMKGNQMAFKKYREILAANESLVIFPEGNHGSEYRLRPLQKGIARIVCGAEDAGKIAVIPVGIHYESHQKYRSRVLVQFGKPVYTDNTDDSSEAVQRLTDRICENLKPLMLDVPAENYMERMATIQRYRMHFIPMSRQLQIEQQLASRGNELSLNIPSFIKKNPFISIFTPVAQLLLVLPSFLIHFFVLKRLSDPQFTASVKFAMGMILVPLWLALLALLLLAFTDSIPVAVSFTIVALGILYYARK